MFGKQAIHRDRSPIYIKHLHEHHAQSLISSVVPGMSNCPIGQKWLKHHLPKWMYSMGQRRDGHLLSILQLGQFLLFSAVVRKN